jgi:hypothetical protein
MSDYDYEGTLNKALSHLKDAGDSVDNMPSRDADSEEHERCLRSAHAHLKAADGYLEDCRDSINDDHDEDEGDPQAGAEEKRRQRARIRQLRSQARQ